MSTQKVHLTQSYSKHFTVVLLPSHGEKATCPVSVMHVVILCCWIITEIKYLLHNHFKGLSTFIKSVWSELSAKSLLFFVCSCCVLVVLGFFCIVLLNWSTLFGKHAVVRNAYVYQSFISQPSICFYQCGCWFGRIHLWPLTVTFFFYYYLLLLIFLNRWICYE